MPVYRTSCHVALEVSAFPLTIVGGIIIADTNAAATGSQGMAVAGGERVRPLLPDRSLRALGLKDVKRDDELAGRRDHAEAFAHGLVEGVPAGAGLLKTR